ncbi:MAG: adenylate kinase family protein [Candidatus Aenigmarchaeota archaeon]|nr:adenylate kinase family protein [Candidatus Aenigmarchaeota archaeon]
MIIIITGTPGTGKTKVSVELVKLLDKNKAGKFKILHLNNEILRHNLWSSIDKKRNSKNVDMKKLSKFVSAETTKNPDILIESHLAHYFKGDVVFVMRAGINELRKRMKKRGWSKAKIEENLEAERLNLILGEALDIHGKKVVEIDTTGKSPKSAAIRMVKQFNRSQ